MISPQAAFVHATFGNLHASYKCLLIASSATRMIWSRYNCSYYSFPMRLSYLCDSFEKRLLIHSLFPYHTASSHWIVQLPEERVCAFTNTFPLETCRLSINMSWVTIPYRSRTHRRQESDTEHSNNNSTTENRFAALGQEVIAKMKHSPGSRQKVEPENDQGSDPAKTVFNTVSLA